MKRFAAIVVFLFAILVNSSGQNQLFFAQNTESSPSWDIGNLAYVRTIDLSSYDANLRGICIKGSNFYVCGISNTKIFQFTINSDGTLSYLTSFDVSYNCNNLNFSTDGTKMFVQMSSGTIYDYTLSTAFNVSTATLNDWKSFSYSNYYGITFQNSTTMFVCYNSATDYVQKITLSTAWSITDATESTTKYTLSNPVGLQFTPDGSRMFVGDSYESNISIRQFSLTSWDVTTTSQTKTVDLYSTLYSPLGFSFTEDGKNIYITKTGGFIYQYSIN